VAGSEHGSTSKICRARFPAHRQLLPMGVAIDRHTGRLPLRNLGNQFVQRGQLDLRGNLCRQKKLAGVMRRPRIHHAAWPPSSGHLPCRSEHADRERLNSLRQSFAPHSTVATHKIDQTARPDHLTRKPKSKRITRKARGLQAASTSSSPAVQIRSGWQGSLHFGFRV
jgi:hypothetical protein